MREIKEIENRIGLTGMFLEFLKTVDDPRAPDAIEHYEAQRDKLEQELQDYKPQPVVIGLQAASLSAVVPNQK